MRIGNLIRGPRGLRIAVDDKGAKPGRTCTLSIHERIHQPRTFDGWVSIDAKLSRKAIVQLRDQLNQFLGENDGQLAAHGEAGGPQREVQGGRDDDPAAR